MLEGFYGNERLVFAIENMLETDRIPQAILFEGEQGLGKHTVARAFAKSVLCGKNAPFCGNCRSCTLFDAGTHPDISVISPDERNVIRVSVIRELRQAAYERPDRSRRKVYVIENAEQMNREAQNAFLKIMEEPPQYVVFLLLCTSARALLETVVSRCTVFTLNAPCTADALKALKAKSAESDEEKLLTALMNYDNNVGKALAQLSDGEESDAETDAEQVLLFVTKHNKYAALALLQKYERDNAGFLRFINSLQLKASLRLRLLAMGKTQDSLSKQQLLRVLNAADTAKKRISQNCSAALFITAFCAELI